VARGNALLVMAAAMSVGAMAYGPLDGLLRTRKWIVVAGVLVTAMGFMALGLLDLPLTAAVAVMGIIGAFGMSYGVLMAHGRSYIPDHLLGRGITLLNVLFIGGAGVLQPISGAVMTRMTDAQPTEAYAKLHAGFGLLLLAALAVYLLARDSPPKA
jgi:MFS family permease